MKRMIKVLVYLLITIPLIKVNAISCYESEIDVNNITTFPCSNIEGDTLTFKDSTTDEDYSKYFTYTITNNETQITIDKSLKFNSILQKGILKVSDGVKETYIFIKNPAYVAPTTTTTTTTTKDPNTKTYTITLDPNNGDEVTKKTCDVNSLNTTCSITLPKMDKDNFSGWGTAKTCKEGNSGTIKVEKDITYYACYKDNETTPNVNATILLKTLSLTNKDTNEMIDFGTFSIKKTNYDIKVLNEVENINVEATTEDDITIEVTGNENLVVGENKIVIKLTDTNDNINEYIINVTRLDVGETLNSIHYLESLVIGGYNIDFSKEKFTYTITINNDIEKLELTAIPEKEEDEIEIIGNENLVDGSQISINITGEDEQITKYTINIIKEDNINILLIIAIGIIFLLIIVLIILIIIKSNKKKKNIINNQPKNLKTSNGETIETLNI